MGDNIFDEIVKDQKRKLIYARSGRELLCSFVKEDRTKKDKDERLILYRKEGRYFISKNGNPIATAATRTDCAKKAFADGYLDDEQYIFFRSGRKAADIYLRNKRNKERLMR